MATKYISSLTGPEMDSALTDMAYHNSEAYAVGTRNGVPVGSSDVTYHNNSKYWAEQVYGYTDRAEDAANRAEAAVPSGTAGAVFFDRAQTLTSAQQSQARANIMAGGSNRNLLDNPFFTVNQRSATTVTLNGTEAYIADRWIAGSFGTYIHNSDNTITITCPNSTAYAGLTQRIDPIYKGGTYTYSVRLSNDTVISLQGTMPSESGLNVYNITINSVSWQVLFRSDGSAYWITLRCNVANTTLTVKAAKLELGSVSTLANDAPPELSIARIPCYENFLRLKGAYAPVGYAIGVSTTLAFVVIPTPVTMRALPNVSLSGTLYFNAGTPFTVTGLASSGTTLGVNQITQKVTGSFVVGKIYLAQFRDATSYIDLSSDI